MAHARGNQAFRNERTGRHTRALFLVSTGGLHHEERAF
eukprot:CAMPEP_0114494994 /NCGR_PEP_ID=MMETSP0109-20121206/4960_1 /TAXON_ID=29199 /ORGANISM="Chlorarachnion reptans, Strain CCCM449" /LENGTH=37 /DNA_ID= /DNA_START= /DNA_END= /DNA_ORIENTATION=